MTSHRYFQPIWLVIFVLFSLSSIAQKKTLSASEAALGYYKGLYPQDLNSLQWVTNTDNYIYSTENAFLITSAKSREITQNIASSLKVTYGLEQMPQLVYVDDKNLVFNSSKTLQIYDYLSRKKEVALFLGDSAENTDYNPYRQAVAYTVANNLYVTTPKEKKIAITNLTDKNMVAGQAIHRREFGITKGTFWSPKGNKLAFYQKNETNVSDYPLVDDINTYPAALKSIKYPMAGQGSEQATIGIFDLATKKTLYLDIDTSDEHYLTNLTWSPNERFILVAEVNRDQNHYSLNRYDAMTGKKINTLFEEENEKWVEPEYEAVFLPHKNNEFLWMSEKNGFMNLYWYNLEGKLIKQLTDFKWVITSVLGFSQDEKYVFIAGTGVDARENRTYKINLKDGSYIDLTPTAGTHKTQLSSGGNYLIDSYSSLSIPHIIDIVNTQNGQRYNILTAENPLKDYNVGTTEFVTLKTDDGTPLYGKIHKPENFDPKKKYPVLVYVYGGPHAQLVTNSWLGGSSFWLPAFAAAEDYIVFTLDNRGSANRGFDFESVIHRQLGESEMKDQLVGIEYLKSLPYVDSSRMAINGWSFGGFMTSSLMLRHPDIFTTAVAGGTVTDWKFYEVMYGERYMDTPEQNPEGYKKSRLGNYMENLNGKILFIHGSTDDIVVPQHILSLLKEAVSKNKQVDFFTYPMHGHNVYGFDRAHLTEKIWKYIVENNQPKK